MSTIMIWPSPQEHRDATQTEKQDRGRVEACPNAFDRAGGEGQRCGQRRLECVVQVEGGDGARVEEVGAPIKHIPQIGPVRHAVDLARLVYREHERPIREECFEGQPHVLEAVEPLRSHQHHRTVEQQVAGVQGRAHDQFHLGASFLAIAAKNSNVRFHPPPNKTQHLKHNVRT
eukprot:772779-Pleurochrysis_carterae.AAC.1